MVESTSYDSFGNGASSLTRYGYTGREWDADSNLYYYRNRWYDPQDGRFISEDPIGFEGGVNLYAYVENNPVNFVDALGLCPDNKGQRCAALIRRMLKQITEMEGRFRRYNPATDWGGHPIRKTMADGTVLDLGLTKPRSHYNKLKEVQRALRENYESFIRECFDRNDNSNPNLPDGAKEWSYKEFPKPYDPNAPKTVAEPSLLDKIWNWFPSLPSQQEWEKNKHNYPLPPWSFPIPDYW